MQLAALILVLITAHSSVVRAQDSTSLQIDVPADLLEELLRILAEQSNNTVTVTDIDECDGTEPVCTIPNSICNNTHGSFDCICQTGFVFDDPEENCNDIDECVEGVCDGISDATCNNAPGNYSCDCDTGFQISTVGNACEDINECGDLDAISCSEDTSVCTNEPLGSYTCACKSGFQSNADGICEDIDECNDANACGDNEDCTNNAGSFVCSCKTGFSRPSDTDLCADVDECDGGSTPCDSIVDAECNNNAGSYSCLCTNSGYHIVDLEDGTRECQDVNECDVNNIQHDCGTNEVCQNTDGGFNCTCAPGFDGDPALDSCTDVDECTSTTPCDTKANCVNKVGGHDCFCNAGYFGSGETDQCADTTTCETFDNLKTNIESIINGPDGGDVSAAQQILIYYATASGKPDGVPGTTFRNKYGSEIDSSVSNVIDKLRCDYFSTCSSGGDPLVYNCTCETGYQYVADSTTQCEDTDECATENSCGNLAVCENNEGSYTCTCPMGYELPAEGNISSDCIDIDECERETSNCNENADCSNEVGKFSCRCKSGFMGDGVVSCESALTCAAFENVKSALNAYRDNNNDTDALQRLKDFNSAQDIPVDGSSDSYKLMYYPTDEMSAIESSVLPKLVCDFHANCFGDTPECTCFSGYVSVDGSTVQCIDVDECESTESCGDTGDCINEQGTYNCNCKEGYEGGQMEPCTDIDECVTDAHSCGDTGTCNNEAGSYSCVCSPGYMQPSDGSKTCIDVDECATGTHSCGVTGTCKNEVGSYICECSSGYELPADESKTCIDINECIANTHTCGDTGTCKNEEGTYSCQCNPGYQESTDGSKACKDIDECGSSTDDCHDTLATCKNTEGSWECTCVTGYRGNGVNCENINECDEGTHTCDSTNGMCTDSDGSFECSCNSGFMGTGQAGECTDVLTCETFTSWKKAIDTLQGVASDDASSITFASQYSSAVGKATGVTGASFREKFDPDENGLDTNIELIIDLGRCDYFSECSSSVVEDETTYTCTCIAGYKSTEANINQCEDVDECADEDSNMCDDVSRATCTNNQGSYTCTCKKGYNGDGQTCTDINECEEETPPCDNHATCTNSEGSYTCACNPQYMGSGLVGDCQDVLTCQTFNDVRSAIDTIQSSNSTDEAIEAARETLGEYSAAADRPAGVTQTLYREKYETADIDSDVANTMDMLRCDIFSECSVDDTEGYLCTCKTGYEDSTTENACQDIDECVEGGSNNCHTNADCTNTIGSFTCQCKSGYFGGGVSCSDHDECLNEGDGHDCDANADCENIEGGHTCTCKAGYYGEGSNGTCKSVTSCDAFVEVKNAITTVVEGTANPSAKSPEEMAAARRVLQEYATATGKATAVSGDSFRLEHSIVDDDIAAVIDQLRCDFYSTCSETDTGDFTCTCESGYITGNDANTCFGVNSCPAFAKVQSAIEYLTTNTEGDQISESTHILEEFKNAGGHTATPVAPTAYENRFGASPITAVTEALALLRCDYFSQCNYDDTAGYTCSCVTGYEDATDPNACQDADECAINNGGCNENADCANNAGSFACACKTGFQGDGFSCADSDECGGNAESTLCGFNAACADTIGSFTCTCNDGYFGDGNVCAATRDCLFSEDAFGADADCTALENKLSCQFMKDFASLSENYYNANLNFFISPTEITLGSESASRSDATFSATVSAGSTIPFCPKTSTYDSPATAYKDSARTMEVELFSYDCHRQWFTKVECSSTPSGIPISCDTEYSPKLALTITKDDSTGKYDVKPEFVYLPTGCQASIVTPDA